MKLSPYFFLFLFTLTFSFYPHMNTGFGSNFYTPEQKSKSKLMHTDRAWLPTSKPYEVPEGRNIILDYESYPREKASFTSRPTLSEKSNQVKISFALNKYDDVIVRVVNNKGKTLKTIGCGVLGPNAPEPFQKNSLKQTVTWDKTDQKGKKVTGSWKIEVGIGLLPQFKNFVGYKPSQMQAKVIDLQVDPQGRVYVVLENSIPRDYLTKRTDPSILRFNRDGSYSDMVYPSNPKALGNQKLEAIYPFVDKWGGKSVPHRPRAWPYFSYREPPHFAYIQKNRAYKIQDSYPLQIDKNGIAYIAEVNSGMRSFGPMEEKKEGFRLYTIDDVDHFFLQTSFAFLGCNGPFVIDNKGFGYLVTNTAPKVMWKDTKTRILDQKASGTIRKIDLKKKKRVTHFAYNGTEKLKKKSAYLGTTQTIPQLPPVVLKEPNSKMDSPSRFVDIVDLAVDDQGKLIVADGYPRRIKLYEPNGKYIGELKELKIKGISRPFRELRAVAVTPDAFYLISSFHKWKKEEMFLVKCTGDYLNPNVDSFVPLAKTADHLVVDTYSKKPIVWVGNGNGNATLTRVVDFPSLQKPEHFGGTEKYVFVSPWAIGAIDQDTVIAHDAHRGRNRIVLYNEKNNKWIEKDLPTRPDYIYVDHSRQRIYFSSNKNPGFMCYDFDLEPVNFKLETLYKTEEEWYRSCYSEYERKLVRAILKQKWYYPWAQRTPGYIGGVDPEGNIYAIDGKKGKIGWYKYGTLWALPENKGKGVENKGELGVIRKYKPDGTIVKDICTLFHPSGSFAMDSKGNFYAYDLPEGYFSTLVHDFPIYNMRDALQFNPTDFKRDGKRLRRQGDLTHLVKFGKNGGKRNKETELWAHRGFSPHSGGGCVCEWGANTLSIDEADRIFGADYDHHLIKVLDTAGNLITTIGTWGNAETVPTNGDGSQVGFRYLYSLDTVGNTLFVGDKELHRIAKFEMTYRQLEVAK